MFFLIPIGHDELTLRGLPFATLGLMAVCIAVFFLTIGATTDDEARAQARAPAVSRHGDEPFHIDESGEVVEKSRAPVEEAPGVEVVPRVVLHVAQLLLTLFFLWIAGVRLEERWSRPVFVGCFALFGVLSALVYRAAVQEPNEPLFGTSGAVAGLMGAMVVCAGRAKAHFAYFVWLGLKPRVGTFEAPAYIMPLLWLVTQLGVQILGMGLGLSLGGMSYVQWISGFAFGAAIAFALKKLRFEERVLHRQPVTKINPEEMPLVAFRPGVVASPSPAREPKLETIEAALSGFDRTALRFELRTGGALQIAAADVRAWTAGTMSVTPLPAAKSVVLAFAVAPSAPVEAARVVIVDAAHLKYSGLLEGPSASPKQAFFRLVARIDAALPEAAFAGDRGLVHAGSLQELGSPRDLAARFGPVLRDHSQSRSSES
ncbi:MAG: rhomboid family intramembrane serine protease [Proteobacteria bacterium]|jgi:membrane associated rhomboid family serine protease|nr:rhomboid family intramembrane serine protease [Pseudomonadota bacterium]